MESIAHKQNTYCTQLVVKTQVDYALILQPQAALLKCWTGVGARELLCWFTVGDFILSARRQETYN